MLAGMETLRAYLKAVRGRASRLAESLGMHPSALSQWTQVPAERALEVERHTGISRHALRPDIYGPAPKKRRAA